MDNFFFNEAAGKEYKGNMDSVAVNPIRQIEPRNPLGLLL